MAIRYAVDNGAQVINMSFGKDSPCKKWVLRFQYAEEHNVYSYIAQEIMVLMLMRILITRAMLSMTAQKKYAITSSM
jgi:type 1 glutamine amidotransferase